jgi:hypothetical protein
MEKTKIETFIKKYTLGGNIEQVRWVSENGTLRAKDMTTDKKLLMHVELSPFTGFPDGMIGVGDTNRLRNQLKTVGDDVTLTMIPSTNDPNRIVQLRIEDADHSFTVNAANPSNWDSPEPKIKTIPAFDVEIKLTKDFIAWFLAAKAAFPEEELFTLVMSKRKQKLQMVIGYKGKTATDDCVGDVIATAGKDTVKAPISFSAKMLKEIILANDDCIEDSLLTVSEAGLAVIELSKDGFTAKYYMMKIDVED